MKNFTLSMCAYCAGTYAIADNSAMNALGIVIAGLLGALAMSVAIAVEPQMNLPKFDAYTWLSGIVSAKPIRPSDSSCTSRLACCGWLRMWRRGQPASARLQHIQRSVR